MLTEDVGAKYSWASVHRIESPPYELGIDAGGNPRSFTIAWDRASATQSWGGKEVPTPCIC